MPQAPAWAFITPSYSGDLDRCKLLCRSMDTYLSGPWHHYLVVDAPDYELFKPLASANRSVLLTHEVVPKGMRHLFNLPFAGGRSLWWSSQAGMMIGWHLQQIVKISMAARVEEEGLAYLDSDVFLLRHFDVASLNQGSRFRMFHAPEAFELEQVAHPRFTRNALEILGLPAGGKKYYDYVDNFVTWHRPTVLDMCAHIERKTGKPWLAAFRSRLQLSEYSLYGQFVDGLQPENPHIYRDSQTLCRTQWGRKPSQSEADLRAFCADLGPAQVAVGIQSFAGVAVGLLEDIFAASLRQPAAAVAPMHLAGP